MRNALAPIITSALLAAALAACAKPTATTHPTAAAPPPAPPPAPAPAPAPAPMITREDSVEVSVTATVQAINYTTREVTLRDSAGHQVTIIADKSIQRLNEVKVGDEVTSRYSVSVLGELRAPTPDEAAHPIASASVSGRAPRSSDPAAGAARAVRVVTTVQAIDLPHMTVTLRGPMGDQATVRAKSPENIRKLHVGDTIIITYTEALAVSLDKASR